MLLMLVSHVMINRLRFTKCLRNLKTDTGILLQIQAFCYRFRHSVTDSGILLQKKPSFVFKASVFLKDGWLRKKNLNMGSSFRFGLTILPQWDSVGTRDF